MHEAEHLAHRLGDPYGTLVVLTLSIVPIEDVWEALTHPDRLGRWFYPISGDLQMGGSFQFEGNAGGEIRNCERPVLLEVTFGSPDSKVALR